MENGLGVTTETKSIPFSPNIRILIFVKLRIDRVHLLLHIFEVKKGVGKEFAENVQSLCKLRVFNCKVIQGVSRVRISIGVPSIRRDE